MTDIYAAVQVNGVRKAFGEVEAVAGLDVAVRAGETVALLGPNADLAARLHLSVSTVRNYLCPSAWQQTSGLGRDHVRATSQPADTTAPPAEG